MTLKKNVSATKKCVVFYSWQSDLPNKLNRGFIQDALEAAAKAIRTDDTLEVEPVIDRDTSGVPGSPDIAQTILAKIDQAQVFVCDVSIVNAGELNRVTPNPNVLIELGYAIKVMGLDRIILVMNTSFGKPEQLPFDLRSKRVLTYEAKEGEADRSPERKKLTGALIGALRAVIETLERTVSENYRGNIQQIEVIRQQRLDNIKVGKTPVPLNGSARMVLQLIPSGVIDTSQTFGVTTLGTETGENDFHLLIHETNCFRGLINRSGLLRHDEVKQPANSAESCIIFSKDGSIEYLDGYCLSRDLNGIPYIPSFYYEQKILTILPYMLKIQQRLGIRLPICVSLSLLNIRGYILRVSEMATIYAMKNSSPIMEDDLIMPLQTVDTFEPNVDQLMRPLFEDVWNASGWPTSLNYDETGKRVKHTH